jgi:hypothetical protein
LELAHPENGHTGRGIEGIVEAIKHETVFMALEQSTNLLIGILIAAPIDENESEKLEAKAKEIEDQKRAGWIKTF